MASGNATVKAVLSADTIVMVGKSVNGSPPEITITLSNIQTPKIARGPQQTDEPFAWEAREFLRRLCIGKQVTFKVVSTVPSINRSFGDVYLNGENLNRAIIAAGWGSVKDQRDSTEGNDYEVLVGLYNSAKAAKLGIHTDDVLKKRNAVRQVNWALDAAAYATNLLGASKSPKISSNPSVHVVVEHVRDGASFRCYLPSASAYVSVALAGIVCPRVNSGASKTEGGESAGPEAFALQARHFSEMRLLNREVNILVHGAAAGSSKVASEGSLLVTFDHPKGNLTIELVKAGLGKVADWTLALLPRETVISLRAAEIEAKSNRRGVWYAYIPPVPSPECRAFEGRVIEVISGDTIIVAERNPEGGFTETRVAFASIRVPRVASGGPAGRTSVSEPFALECKEFVRSRLIGKQVLVAVEYVREKRLYASVYYGKPTRQPGGVTRPGFLISEQLIVEGLAQTVKHRPEEPRAEAYDTMLVDEAEAQRKKKGVHSNPGAPAIESTSRGVNDLTSDGKKAKAFFNLLQKDKTFRAMVDHVYTGSRYKLTIPSENATFTFALAQVRCPSLAKSQTNVSLEEGEVPPTEDPLAIWGENAKRFSRLNILQRSVDIEFTDIDRNGVMLGRLSLVGENKSTSRAIRGHSYALDLVTEGLASVDKYAVHRGGPEIDQLVEAQRKAQELQTGLWSVPGAMTQNEPVNADEEGGEKQSNDSGVVRVKLTEIYTGSTFAVHVNSPAASSGVFAGRGNDVLAEIESTMSASADALGSSSALTGSVRKGNLVACLHDDPTADEGSAWIRARVEEITGSSAKVFFIDYGHRAEVPISTLRSLTDEMAAYTPQSIDCSLAFLRAPSLASEYGVPAARALNDLAWNKECMMTVLSSSDPSFNSKSRSNKSGSNSASSSSASSSSSVRYAVVLFALPSNGEELDIDNALNVNEKLVRSGFVRISATSSRRLRGGRRRGNNETDHSTGSVAADALAVLETAQSQAHLEHLRIWTYGDPGDSDDEAEEKRAA